MSESFIYFVRCGDFIKIGFSKFPKRRLSFLAVGNPLPITIAAAYLADPAYERQLHRMFSEYRERGEWFRSSEAIETVIKHGLPPLEPEPLPEYQKAVSMSAALGGFLTSVAITYARAVDRKLSTVSLAAADDPNVLPRIAAAPGTANFTIDRFDRVIRWFIEHWPPDTKWPNPPEWPFPIFMTLSPAGERNGKASEERRKVAAELGKASSRKAEAKAGKAAKLKQGTKGSKGRKKPRQGPQPAARWTEPG